LRAARRRTAGSAHFGQALLNVDLALVIAWRNLSALPSREVRARARHHPVPEYHVAGAHVAWGAALP